MKNDNDLLADMPVPAAFFKLAIPAIAAQLINILYNLVDKMFIGRIPGVGKQALVSLIVLCNSLCCFCRGLYREHNHC